MEILGELAFALLECFGDMLLEVLGEVLLDKRLLFDLLWELSYFLIGITVGGGSLWVVPQRVFSASPLPGLSLILGPVALAAVFALCRWPSIERSPRGPWQAGAQLGFGLALVRYLVLAP